MINYFRLIPLIFKLRNYTSNVNSIFFNSVKELDISYVKREEFLEEISKSKRVIHFGFLDSPFAEEKINSGCLLHFRLKKVANYLYGADIDANSLEKYREITNDKDNTLVDIQDDKADFSSFSNSFNLILFPEILEHLKNPEQALENLKKISYLNNKAKLCITVPNAFFAGNFFAAVNGYEIVHPEHYYYFSPVTLKKLLIDSGFTNIKISLYVSDDMKKSPGIVKNGVIAICEPK